MSNFRTLGKADTLLDKLGARQWLDTGNMVRSLLLGGSWLVLWRLAVLMEYAPHASIWFPPAGLSFAAFLVMGLNALPVIALCGFVATFWVDAMYGTQQPWLQLAYSGLLFALAHSLSYWGGAALLRRMFKDTTADALPRFILGFLILGSLSALFAALLGTQVLAITGLITADEASGIWLPWWIGDMAGVIVLTPLFIGLLCWRYPSLETRLGGLDFRRSGRGRYAYLLKLLLSASLLSLTMLLAARFREPEVSFAIFFLIIPQMWIVYTESAFRTALSLAVFSTLTAIGVTLLGLMKPALVYQFAICVIAASAYFGLAVPVLAAHNRQLKAWAHQDGLTGISSRLYFFECGEQKREQARRYHQPVSLLVFDIDHFKQINDRYGHTMGDTTLATIADSIRPVLRQSDLFGRFGGDEFMLLLPGIALDQALDTSERLRRLLQEQYLADIEQRLSASFGVVEIQPEESLMDAFERADENLFKAKRGGRNRVCAEPPAR